MADFLSRWPTFEKYFPRKDEIAHLPDELFEDLQEIPLFTHQLGPDDTLLKGWRYTLVEAKKPKEAEHIWQAQVALADLDDVSRASRTDYPDLASIAHYVTEDEKALAASMPSIATMFSQAEHHEMLPGRIAALREMVTRQEFWAEQQTFEEYASGWEDYVEIFEATHGRAPVLYDFYCGEGGFSRGARASGAQCIGFDNDTARRAHYELEPSAAGPATPSGMTFVQADLENEEFWTELRKPNGRYAHLPKPDMIHASPPCNQYSKARHMGLAPPAPDNLCAIDQVIRRLRQLEQHFADQYSLPLLWQVENVPESKPHVTEPVDTTVQLCGTMMGHQVFRHRNFYCNYAALAELPHRHAGKVVGSHGLYRSKQTDASFVRVPEPNMYGVYSRPYAARGSAADWHGALGSVPNSFSTHGLRGALPIGYGRLLTSQMAAHSLRRQFEMPIDPPFHRDELAKASISLWKRRGYVPLSAAHAIGSVAPTVPVAQLDVPTTDVEDPDFNFFVPAFAVDALFQEDEEVLPGAAAAAPVDSPYVFGREQQLKDPVFGPQIALLERPATGRPPKGPVIPEWELSGGALHKIEYQTDGGRTLKLAVPDACRLPLMTHLHYMQHRGHRPLLDAVAASYYWPNFRADCLDFTRTCQVCQQVSSQPMMKAATQPIPTPSRPFSVIHVDHKGPLPARRSDRYNHILVISCALTRFTLLLPVETTQAEETLKTLVARVFSVFGTPAAVVTDNGPAFVSGLGRAMADYFGYRHIHVLPYNAQANGTAESAVKRIKLLLDRQTKGYRDWHRLLPLMQLLLNSATHTSTGVSHFCALFGREPDGLERLENPALYPDGDGHQFLTELRGRMVHLHRELQQYSDAIKEARVREDNARLHARMATAHHGQILPSTPQRSRYVWMIHGSKEQAQYLRKHGHGTPWRHKYKVLEVKPHAVRLEVPKDGSVPIVNEWQLIRRMSPAHEHEHSPDEHSPVLTDMGVPLPSVAPRSPPQGEDSDVYDIEIISHAERVGNVYKVWIKWKGYDEITWRWRHELIKETSNDEILKQIDDAVAQERLRYGASITHAGDSEVEDAAPGEAGAVAEPQAALLGRGQRVRPPVNYLMHTDTDWRHQSSNPIAHYREYCRGQLFYVEEIA